MLPESHLCKITCYLFVLSWMDPAHMRCLDPASLYNIASFLAAEGPIRNQGRCVPKCAKLSMPKSQPQAAQATTVMQQASSAPMSASGGNSGNAGLPKSLTLHSYLGYDTCFNDGKCQRQR